MANLNTAHNCRIFVGGIPTFITKDEVWHALIRRYKIENIVNVIMYRSRYNRAENRGFVFLDFRTNQEASFFQTQYADKLILFGKQLFVDWAIPISEAEEKVVSQGAEKCVLMMAVANVKYYFENSSCRRILYSPVKKLGFVPEKDTEIFVSTIPAWATVYDLARFFEQVGELFQVRLMMHQDGTRNRGFAFVTYMNATLTQKALDKLCNKPFFDTQCLSIQKSVNNCRIFVGGLPTEKTKDEIWQKLLSMYNITNIVDVITYRNYSNLAHNRGFVFLEFRTHEEAAYFRAKYADKLILFGKKLLVDWSLPVLEINNNMLSQVKIIFLRNLDVTLSSEEFGRQIYRLINRSVVEKVYKFKNYAYVHLNSRPNAEKLLDVLKGIYNGTEVEVTWAKPPNKFTCRNFRNKILNNRSAKVSMGTAPVQLSNLLVPSHDEPHSPSPDNTRTTPNFMGTGYLSRNTPANFLAPRTQLMDWSQNILINSDYGASTSFNGNSPSQRTASDNFVVPILPPNLTPFHQIQPFYQSPSFQMNSSGPISNLTVCKNGILACSSSFSTFTSGLTAAPAKTEIGLNDLEAIVNGLLTEW